MSQKAEKPVLSGQRIKTRKRDEREKYDPTGFRDAVIQGLDKAGNDLEAVSKFLDTAGSKLDYRRYGEALFDILIAGGLLGMFSSSIFFSIPIVSEFIFSVLTIAVLDTFKCSPIIVSLSVSTFVMF